MRNELNEAVLIDRYLHHQLDEEELAVFRTRLLTNDELHEKVQAQSLAHRLIRRYARQELRRRLEGIYQQLLNEPTFAHQLKTLL